MVLVAEVACAREPRCRWRGCSRLHEACACKDALLANGGGSAVTVGRGGMGQSVTAIGSGGAAGGRGVGLANGAPLLKTK